MITPENPEFSQKLNPKAALEAYLGGEGLGSFRYEALADLATMTYYEARIAYFLGDRNKPVSVDDFMSLATLASIRETVRVRTNGENGQAYRQAFAEARFVLEAYEAETRERAELGTFGHVIRYESMPPLLHDLGARF